MKPTPISYEELSDAELIDLILHGNEEAAVYLIHSRHTNIVQYHVWRYYHRMDRDLIQDFTNDVYADLKGGEPPWRKLRGFAGRSQFKTWLSKIVSHIVLNAKIAEEKKGLEGKKVSIEETPRANRLAESSSQEENSQRVMMLEAIARLEDEEQRFVLIQLLEGYSPEEIAAMLQRKREQQGIKRKRHGEDVVITPGFVYTKKSKGLQAVKLIIEQLKKEWYEN